MAAAMDVEPPLSVPTPSSTTYRLPDVNDEDTLIQVRAIANEKFRRSLIKQFVLFQRCLREKKLDEARLVLDICLKETDDISTASYKSRYTSQTSSTDITRYQSQKSRIEEEITSAQLEIETLKKRLEKAQEERKNRMEYDELARRILRVPERKENERQITQLETDLASLLSSSSQLASEWTLRQKQFASLIVSATQLRTIIAESKQAAEEDAARGLDRQEEEEGALNGEAMDVS